MLMCDFRLNRRELKASFPGHAAKLDPTVAAIAERYGDLVDLTDDTLDIHDAGRSLTRIIASEFDAHVPDGIRYSQAS